MNKRETIKYKGFKIKTYYDEDANSPQEWDDDFVFLVFDHRDFCVRVDGYDPTEIFEAGEKVKGYHVFRCYAYIHSGVALSVGYNSRFPDQRWDVSFKGFWLVKKEKGYTWREDKARKVAEGICKTWNQYLSGEVYGYQSKAGSCWGYYGNEGYKYMIEEAKLEIDCHIKNKIKEHVAQVKMWITNKIPLENRTKCKYV